MASKSVAVGIDLGTTFSCVAAFQDGKVIVCENEVGNRITPSYVSFDEKELFIGNAAKEQATVNSSNTIYEVKLLIGRKYDDPTVQEDRKLWPFKVIAGEKNEPKIEVHYKNERKVLVPEQISSQVLMKMKEIAELRLGCCVQDAVITVPAYFTDSQRQATIDAGIIAGLNVLGIMNEPTAAAIAYGMDAKVSTERNVLIFDLGGGTFDVAILSIAEGKIEVKSVGGDTHLGGGDFDDRILQHFLAFIKKKYSKDISGDPKAMGRLRDSCVTAKLALSGSESARVDIACLFDGIDFEASISKTKFEHLCEDLFQKTIEHVKTTLQESGLRKDQVHEVVLVGGSTRIPRVRQLLTDFFDGKKLNMTINADEAVAFGAAIKAALLSGESTVEEMSMIDVIPLSLSVENPDGTVTTALKRNSPFPTSHALRRTTTKDYLKQVIFNIYEGERRLAKDNVKLGDFLLENIEYAKKGEPKFDLTFNVDSNGILHVTAIDKKTESTNSITITSNKGRLDKVERERMAREAAEMNTDNLRNLSIDDEDE